MTFWKKSNYRERKHISGSKGSGAGKGIDCRRFNGVQGIFQDDGNTHS
jgi:hypothetical protein